MNQVKKESIVYQIYPRSFYDSNQDGIGDIKGIIEKVPYLVSLGINTLWLSPVYASPMDDNGYDISNYFGIHEEYGTLEDIQSLIETLHKHNIKLIMDLVINHTSDEHPWFLASKENKDGKENYYIWRKGKKNNRKPPSNWTSFFTGKAWEYVEEKDAYYLHLFSKKQPDLNWEHAPLREDIKKMIKFWIDLGVDGFRLDVINLISKNPHFPKGKFNIALVGKEHYLHGPKVHNYLHDLNQSLFSPHESITVGECVFTSPKEGLDYVGEHRKELDMIFHFEHMAVDTINNKWFIRPFKMKRLKKVLDRWQKAFKDDGWNTLYLENHDQPRSVSRFGDDTKYLKESAKVLAICTFMQKGTPYIYQGQELGMTNAYFDDLHDYRDIETHNVYKLGRKTLKLTHNRMMKKIKYMSRDNARTPMQWNDTLHAGFTKGTPWIKLNSNYPSINVLHQEKDKDSVLNFYKELITLRKKYPVFIDGDYRLIYPKHKQLYAYFREDKHTQILILCNFSNKPLKITFDTSYQTPWTLLLSNYKQTDDVIRKDYRPYEALILKRTR